MQLDWVSSSLTISSGSPPAPGFPSHISCFTHVRHVTIDCPKKRGPIQPQQMVFTYWELCRAIAFWAPSLVSFTITHPQ